MRLPTLFLRLWMLLTVATVSSLATAQTLAHPLWRGNGIAPEAWWHHTTLVRFPQGTTFAQATAGIDALSAVSADTLILSALATSSNPAHPFADIYGTEDDLDTLLREVSAHRMHLLLQAPLARLAANPGEVRFWMNRGIAGFDVGTVTPADSATLQALRNALDHFPIQRILLARWADTSTVTRSPLVFRIVSDATPAQSTAAPQFVELTATSSATGLNAVDTSQGAVDPPDQTAALLRSFLPLLLAQGQPIFDSRTVTTQAGRDALQQIMQIRNLRPSLRGGQAIALQNGDLRAWLLRGSGTQHAMVILENTGATSAGLHLQQPLHAANARGTFLRAILRTDGGMGAIHLEGSSIPPGAIAICELQ